MAIRPENVVRAAVEKLVVETFFSEETPMTQAFFTARIDALDLQVNSFSEEDAILQVKDEAKYHLLEHLSLAKRIVASPFQI